MTISLMIYQYAFGQMNTMGYAAALAVILAIIIFIASRLAEKLNSEKDIYFFDDTHWSPVAAELIAKKIKELIRNGQNLNAQ